MKDEEPLMKIAMANLAEFNGPTTMDKIGSALKIKSEEYFSNSAYYKGKLCAMEARQFAKGFLEAWNEGEKNGLFPDTKGWNMEPYYTALNETLTEMICAIHGRKPTLIEVAALCRRFVNDKGMVEWHWKDTLIITEEANYGIGGKK